MSDDSDKKPEVRPQRWWQWVLVYPALGIALVTGAPQIIDVVKDVTGVNASPDDPDIERRIRFWATQNECTTAPYEWVDNPQNIKVDGTICKSGDIFLRILVPGKGEYYEPIFLADIVDKHTTVSQASNPRISLAELFVTTAHAAPAPEAAQTEGTILSTLQRIADGQFATVVCQKKIADSTTMLRHVKVGSKCYDEHVDIGTGKVIKKPEVKCRSTC